MGASRGAANAHARYEINAGRGGGSRSGNALSQANRQSKRANKANKRRRDDINAGFDSRRENANNATANLGQAETRRIEESGVQAQASSQQNLTSRGLAGTTVLQGNNNAIRQGTNNSLSDLNERVAMQKFNLTDNIDAQQLGFKERIDESGPDMNQLLALLQLIGRGQGGGGFSGGGAQTGSRNSRLGFTGLF